MRARTPEAFVEGWPELAVQADDNEALAELVADMLVAVIEREIEERA